MYPSDENPFEQLRRQNEVDCTIALVVAATGALSMWLFVPDRLDTGVAIITMTISLLFASGLWRK